MTDMKMIAIQISKTRFGDDSELGYSPEYRSITVEDREVGMILKNSLDFHEPWELFLDCLDGDGDILLFRTPYEAGLYAQYIHGEKILRRYYEDLEDTEILSEENSEENLKVES